ncbi:MAG: hypothetical protein ACPGTH_07770 [Parvibaculales bacterium]
MSGCLWCFLADIVGLCAAAMAATGRAKPAMGQHSGLLAVSSAVSLST